MEKEKISKRSGKEYPVSKHISTKRKGDIVETRVAELVSLYCAEPLTCYRPMSDDEGVDLIVKKKDGTECVFLQVKSRYSGRVMPSVKDTFPNNNSFAAVFCRFDTSAGDIENVWYVPAPDLHRESSKKDGWLRVTASEKTWGDYLIDKRSLAEKILEQMARNA